MDNPDIALIIVFNHRYDKNLPVLENLYKDRFSNRFYLVPFYDGEMENVIPVYGRSIFFESYIAQGANVFINQRFKHYLFVADDMIIHPQINEKNYQDFFEVKDGQSFIPDLIPLQDIKKFWIGTMSAFYYLKKQKYIEADRELPTEAEAMSAMERQNLVIKELTRYDLFKDFTFKVNTLANKARLALRTLCRIKHPLKKSFKLPYPMVGSYSDIALVANQDIQKFTHYCGVFGATCLFAEVAIPTALVLSANDKIRTEKEMKRRGKSYWSSPEAIFWESEESHWDNLEKNYKNLDDILTRFPDNQLYMHPVKLSKWIKK